MIKHAQLPAVPPALTVDIVLFTIEKQALKVLLIKRAGKPYRNFLALPGSFLLGKETTREAAIRTLKNKAGLPRRRVKAGVKNVYLEQLYTFDSPKRDPRGRVVTVAYFALVNPSKIAFDTGNSLQAPTLAHVYKLPKLAFDHRDIIAYALERLRYKLEYTNVIYSLLPPKFTLSELQGAYATILRKKLDKRNFRKKFASLGLIRKTKEASRGNRHRPAQLYEFVKRRPTALKRFF